MNSGAEEYIKYHPHMTRYTWQKLLSGELSLSGVDRFIGCRENERSGKKKGDPSVTQIYI